MDETVFRPSIDKSRSTVPTLAQRTEGALTRLHDLKNKLTEIDVSLFGAALVSGSVDMNYPRNAMITPNVHASLGSIDEVIADLHRIADKLAERIS